MTDPIDISAKQMTDLLSLCVYHMIELNPEISLNHVKTILIEKRPNLANDQIFAQIIEIIYDIERDKYLALKKNIP